MNIKKKALVLNKTIMPNYTTLTSVRESVQPSKGMKDSLAVNHIT